MTQGRALGYAPRVRVCIRIKRTFPKIQSERSVTAKVTVIASTTSDEKEAKVEMRLVLEGG